MGDFKVITTKRRSIFLHSLPIFDKIKYFFDQVKFAVMYGAVL